MADIFEMHHWRENPFTLKISPNIFIGYQEQRRAVLQHIGEKHKIALLLGPTGAGKTNMLKWLEENHRQLKTLYISKPPQQPEEFITIFLEAFPLGIIERLFRKKPSLFNLPAYINKKFRAQLLILLDESHEISRESLEWLRVLTDQIESVSLLVAGLPVLESKIRDNLETFEQRITRRIRLTSLNEQETEELIRTRIESVGGSGTAPFSEDALQAIYKTTGGFPREVLKFCDKLVGDALEKGVETIDASFVGQYTEFKEKPEEAVVAAVPQPAISIQELPYKQRKLLELLSKKDWLTPTQIAEELGTESYKSEDHAVRSINNILHRLMIEGFVQRETKGKAFMYTLTPKVKTLFVEA